jgi:hypothetical protein
VSGRLTDQQRRDRLLSEEEFRSQVNDLAEMLGWSWMTVGPLRTSYGWRTATRGPLGKGWIDTTYVHPRQHRLLLVEFKKQLGKVEPEQAHVHTVLRAAGLDVRVWRPSDIDEITEALR